MSSCILHSDTQLFIGMMTKQLLNRLADGGDISPQKVKVFYNAVREFYTTAAKYALSNLPLKDAVLENSQFVHFGSRESATISQVFYFVSR